MIEKCKDCKTEMTRQVCSWGCLTNCKDTHPYCHKCDEFKDKKKK